jgi:hypothetical protein
LQIAYLAPPGILRFAALTRCDIYWHACYLWHFANCLFTTLQPYKGFKASLTGFIMVNGEWSIS